MHIFYQCIYHHLLNDRNHIYQTIITHNNWCTFAFFADMYVSYVMSWFHHSHYRLKRHTIFYRGHIHSFVPYSIQSSTPTYYCALQYYTFAKRLSTSTITKITIHCYQYCNCQHFCNNIIHTHTAPQRSINTHITYIYICITYVQHKYSYV